jgi:antitoxin HicB
MKMRRKTMTGKAIEYYLDLPYALEIVPDDGAWFVQIKELPGCITEVDEWADILPAINDAKRLWLELALERGRPIPEPALFAG